MAESILDLAFDQVTLNDPQVVEKFGSFSTHVHAQDLFVKKGRDLYTSTSPDVARWQEIALSRKPAPAVGRKSVVPSVGGVGDDLKTSVIADFALATDPIPLVELTSIEAAQNWLAAEFKDKRKRLSIARELLAWQTLKGGAVVNGTNFPGSKVSFSTSFAVTTLTHAAGKWNNKSTPIASGVLDEVQTVYQDACGMEIGSFTIDNLVQKYMKANDEIVNIIKSDPNPNKAGTVLGPTGKSFEFEDITWNVTRSKYDSSGSETPSLTKFLGDDKIIALPDDENLSFVLGHHEGYGAIPQQAISSVPIGGMGMPAPNRGEYAYAYLIPNPAAVVVVFGWRGLFVLTWPEAVGYDSNVNS